jgi:hypothetical protein
MKKRHAFFAEFIANTARIIFGLVLVLLFMGCATSIPIKSVRPPTIDTSSIQRLAIKPFENNSGVRGQLGAQLSQYLTDKTTQFITSAGKFTIVAPSDPNADGIFTGEIKNIEVKDSKEREEKKDDEGNVYIETTYNREVSVSFAYSVLSSRTDMPIGTLTKQGSSSDSTTDEFELSDPLTLAREIVDTQLNQLQQDIIPTIVSTNRTLMKETSKDKLIKQRMKDAQTLVKNGHYEEAIRQYDEIGSAAARTNSSILKEAIASDVAANSEIAQFFSQTSGLREKAVEGSIESLHAKLPPGTNIMIVKTSPTENNMLNDVVDEITQIIVDENNFNVIDRSHQSLINAEQEFQYSGYVSDDSMVEVGRQLGVHYMLLFWISGEKSLRQFNLKVLNVETAQITTQNSFEI